MQWIFEPSCQVWYECGPPWSGECCITVQQTEITDKRARESAELGTRTWLSIYHWVMRQELQMCDNNFIVCSLLLIGLLSDQSESLLLFFIKWIVKSSSSCHQGKYSYKWNMCNNFGDFGMALGFDSITPFCKNLLWDPIEWYDDAISASSHSLMCTRSMMSPTQGGSEQEASARCTSSGRRTQRRNMLPSTRNSPATSWKKLYSQTLNNVKKIEV